MKRQPRVPRRAGRQFITSGAPAAGTPMEEVLARLAAGPALPQVEGGVERLVLVAKARGDGSLELTFRVRAELAAEVPEHVAVELLVDVPEGSLRVIARGVSGAWQTATVRYGALQIGGA